MGLIQLAEMSQSYIRLISWYMPYRPNKALYEQHFAPTSSRPYTYFAPSLKNGVSSA